MFSDNLCFFCFFSCLLFNVDCLVLLVCCDKWELWCFLFGVLVNILVCYCDLQSLVVWIKVYLCSLWLGCWLDVDVFVGYFFMVFLILCCKLFLEGQSYQVLKDQVCCDLVIVWLDVGVVNFVELVLELGFVDGSVFYKVFKKWIGLIFGQYWMQVVVEIVLVELLGVLFEMFGY